MLYRVHHIMSLIHTMQFLHTTVRKNEKKNLQKQERRQAQMMPLGHHIQLEYSYRGSLQGVCSFFNRHNRALL